MESGNGSTDHTKLGNGSVDYSTSENGPLDHRTMGLGVRDITRSETGSLYHKALKNSSFVDHLRLTTRFKSYEDHTVMQNGSVNDTRMENGLIITNKTILDVIQEFALGPGQEDPFYVLDLGDVIQKVEAWRELMPRIKIFYAVKCNDTNTLLETLAILGTGFDCASKKEIRQVLSLGVSPSRIIYAHPCKSEHDLRYASKVNLPLMTFDSREELVQVKKCYPQEELVLRILCDALKATYKFGSKYGAPMEDTRKLLSMAKDLGLDVVGVSFHVGSDCREPEAYSRAIAKAKQVFDEAEALGMRLTLLDIGGGFPGRISDGLENFASVINSALDEHFPPQDHNDLKIIGEPGRYIATSAFTLATSIRAKKTAVVDGQVVKMYYINDGVYGSFSETRFVGEIFSPVVLNKATDEEDTERSMIWGPTCCSLDIINRAICLPSLECGDWFYWPGMGAYTMVFAAPFNGFPKPSIHSVASPEVWSCLQELSEKYIPSGINLQDRMRE
ncbi:ornithine decarboxylase-like isoform X2 [Macrobrachium nipponense]|uniref:ornithine decarboxylase-like isoform X2 n=1 Tax=Macrobrachium nipponense TaxID=159736 RepID=UPI0030C86A62